MEFFISHIGINPNTVSEAQELRSLLSGFGMSEPKETPLAWFAGNGVVEILKEPGRGTKGHLGIYTSDLSAAVKLLEQLGYHTDPASAKYAPDGSVRLIYLDREFNGFAVHLTTTK